MTFGGGWVWRRFRGRGQGHIVRPERKLEKNHGARMFPNRVPPLQCSGGGWLRTHRPVQLASAPILNGLNPYHLPRNGPARHESRRVRAAEQIRMIGFTRVLDESPKTDPNDHGCGDLNLPR